MLMTLKEMNGKTMVKARIGVYCGGKYGRNGEYIAIVVPEFFKNGNMKSQSFRVVEEIETIKKPYAYGTARVVESIKDVLEVVE